MIFALDKDNGELLALSSPDEALEHCKPIDVKDGFWLFFADDGSPLEPWFEPPDPDGEAISPGPYALQRALSGLWLQERLRQIRKVSGCGLRTPDDLDETLKINRGKRAAADAKRR